MSELLKKQKFGVEVEFTGITRTMAAEAVAEILGSHAAGPDRTCYRTYTIRDSKRRIWKVMRDSSICPVRKICYCHIPVDQCLLYFFAPRG